MPNSPWTETGNSISLVPSTVTIGSDPENVNYLSNQDKINLMAQYAAELAMKTQLDTLSSTWDVSSTVYDGAVGAISTALINAGAPANWDTAWPDGTTSGPWPGIQTSLSNLWAQVAVQRTALQSSISSAQAAAAFTASLAVPTVVSSLPSLPSASYPSGAYVFCTAAGMMYQSTGSAWTALTVSGSSLVANSVTAAQIAANTITATQMSAGYVYAGNISANQITTGTLNAANVNVTNLNASNITTGTLSASKVQFPDGSALTTAGVQTLVANQSSQAHVSGVSMPGTAIPGLSLTATTASANDVYNLFISLCIEQTAGNPGDNCILTIEVDGVVKQTLYLYCATLNITQSAFTMASFTGWSAGTHTITLYLGSSLSIDAFTCFPTSMLLCQRIF
jgi:hypothetical protein